MARNTRKISKPNGRKLSKRKGNKKTMKKQKGGGGEENDLNPGGEENDLNLQIEEFDENGNYRVTKIVNTLQEIFKIIDTNMISFNRRIMDNKRR